MDTIENVDNIIDEKPVEKPKKRNQHGKITQRQQLGDRRPDGTYDHRPLDPNYYCKYVMTPVQCPLCHLMTRRGHIHRHQQE
jgi:hypothetical protein